MAKKGGSSREVLVWSFTMLTLALSCAALSLLIEENADLKAELAATSITESLVE